VVGVAANISGVMAVEEVDAFTLAPWSKSTWATAGRSKSTAFISGVMPELSETSSVAP
jgi:hypothetical protein